MADPTAAQHFYATAFGLGPELRLRASQAATTGFRGFTLSLTVSQPATVSALIAAALDAGATTLKPAAKSLWGYGGVVQAPDGTIWKVATSKKKDSGPATREVDRDRAPAGRRRRAPRASGSTSTAAWPWRRASAASTSSSTAPSGAVTLGLYGRRALAKDAGVAPEGSGSHRLAIGSDAGPSPTRTGSTWEAAAITVDPRNSSAALRSSV